MASIAHNARRIRELQTLAMNIRRQVLLMVNKARSSHVGTSYSMAEILAVLYSSVLRVDPARPNWPERDRFILSKGHGCAGLYAVLAELGFFPRSWLEGFYQNGSRLAGHIAHPGVPGVEVSTGALGHGLPIGCGMALAAKRDDHSYRIVTLLSDGECDEGSTWEAAMFAAHHGLDNLVAIVDYNKIQSLGAPKDILGLEPFAGKWRAFGWAVREIDGHDIRQVEQTLTGIPFSAGRPSCVIAHTVKGKGVSFMENKVLWHYRAPDPEEFAKALAELGEPE